jgi:WD40 repeat protein
MFPDGQRFATTWHSSTIRVLKIDTGEVVREMDHGDIVRTIAVSKDGSRLVSGGLNNLLHVWDTSTGERIGGYDGHKQYIARALFSPDGKQVFSGGEDKQLVSWDATSGKERLRIAHPDAIWGLAISPDGSRVLTGTGGPLDGRPLLLKVSQGSDNALRLWETSTGKLVREMRGHTHAVFSLDISPDGRLAVSGGWDGTTRLWNLETGRELSRIEAEQGRVAKVVFSPDGKHVMVGGGGRRADTGRIEYFPNEQIRVYKLVPSR